MYVGKTVVNSFLSDVSLVVVKSEYVSVIGTFLGRSSVNKNA